jgi:hypothetical protein
VAEFETVRHGLGGVVNPQGHALDRVCFDALMQGGTGEADDPQTDMTRTRTPALVAEGQPDFVRVLCRQAMKVEGREQADDAVGRAGPRFLLCASPRTRECGDDVGKSG